MDRQEARACCGRPVIRSRAASDPRRRAPRRMKLAINLLLSFGMLALCLWLIWPDHETREQVGNALRALDLHVFAPYLVGYVALLLVMHLCRSLRWNNLL